LASASVLQHKSRASGSPGEVRSRLPDTVLDAQAGNTPTGLPVRYRRLRVDPSSQEMNGLRRTGSLSRGSVNNATYPRAYPSQPGPFLRTSGPLKGGIRWLEFTVGWRQLAPLMLLGRLRGEISWASQVLQEERSIHTRGLEIQACSSTAPAAPALGWANCRCTSLAILPNDHEPAPPERAPVPGKAGLEPQLDPRPGPTNNRGPWRSSSSSMPVVSPWLFFNFPFEASAGG
jgi:hypothetical protein